MTSVPNMPGAFSVLSMRENVEYNAMGYCVLFVGFEQRSFLIQQHFVQLRIHRSGPYASQLSSHPFGDFLHHRRPFRIA